MIRKIIKQGNGAYTLTLPKNWVLGNNLVEELEVEIKELDNDLLISSKHLVQETNKSIYLQLDLNTKESYRSIIGSLYRFGYDEIKIQVSESSILSILEQSINSLFGLELFYEKNNICIIKSIYSNENTKVKSHIQRMVYSIQLIQEIIVSDLEKKEFNSIQYVTELRNNSLKQRDLILRIIKKQKLLDDSIFPYYTIALSLWSIVRNYFHMYKHLEKNDLKYIELLKKVNGYFNSSFQNLESITEKKALELHKNYSVLFNELTQNLLQCKMNSFCLNVVIETQLAQSSLYILNISKYKA